MKLYNQLILTEKQKKVKKQFEAPKKTKLGLFPGRLLPCEKNNRQYTTF